MGIDAYDSYDFEVGEQIHDFLIKRIKQADFAIIIITEKNINVFYEMGICEGLDKALFILVAKDIEPPYFVQKHVFLKTDLQNEDLLRISLTKFVEDFRSKKLKQTGKRKRSKSNLIPLTSVDNYLNAVRKLREHGTAFDVEQLAVEILNKLNLQFESSHFRDQDKGVDIAIWDDNLAFTIGNPLFIQVKYGTLTSDQIRNAENQLREYIAKTEAKAAILLYLDKHGRRFLENYSLAPLILRYDLEDFVKALSQNTFKDVILSKRNKMVHGILE
jgi:hypothetical protein